MTSVQGGCTPILTQTWRHFIKKNSEKKVCETVEKTSLEGVLEKNLFMYYLHIVKLAGYDSRFSGNQASFTLFVCPDKYLLSTLASTVEESKNMIINMDQNTAMRILLFNTIDGRLNTTTLYNQSMVYYLNPRLKGHSILLECTDQNIVLDGSSRVISGDIMCNNGIIHIVDRLLLPSMSMMV